MPIQIQPHPLSVEHRQQLLSLLLRDEISILKRVVESKALECEVTAVNEAADMLAHPKFSDSAMDNIRKGARYRNFISVIDEVLKDLGQETAHTSTFNQ